MRVVLASVLVFAGIMVAVDLIGPEFDRFNPLVVGLALAVCFVALTLVTLELVDPRLPRQKPGVSREEYLQQLEEKGFLVATEFRAQRAVFVDDCGDGGPHYFLDLAPDGVLCLTGQYLHDYEPVHDKHDPEPRRFPCTEFTVHRYRKDGYVFEIVCHGTVFEPDLVIPAKMARWQSFRKIPHDGEIITRRTFDEVVGMLLGTLPKQRRKHALQKRK
jgi:hypothetical protein